MEALPKLQKPSADIKPLWIQAPESCLTKYFHQQHKSLWPCQGCQPSRKIVSLSKDPGYNYKHWFTDFQKIYEPPQNSICRRVAWSKLPT